MLIQKGVELRHLYYFLAVADTMSFSKAAKSLGLTQPTLSQTLSQLEKAIDIELIARDKRNVTLTTAGHHFKEKVENQLNRLENTVLSIKDYHQCLNGYIKVSCAPTAMLSWLPKIFKDFKTTYPGVRLDLSEQLNEKMIHDLQHHVIDAAILHHREIATGLFSRVLYEEDLVLALPNDHPKSNRDNLSLEEIQGEGFLFIPRKEDPFLYDRFIACFQQWKVSPRIIQEESDPRALVNMVSSGIGLGLVPRSVSYLSHPGIRFCSIKEEITFSMSIAWREGENNTALEQLIDKLEVSLKAS